MVKQNRMRQIQLCAKCIHLNWKGQISEDKHNSKFHGKTNDKVEQESFNAPMGSLILVFSLTPMSELAQSVCVKMNRETQNLWQ